MAAIAVAAAVSLHNATETRDLPASLTCLRLPSTSSKMPFPRFRALPLHAPILTIPPSKLYSLLQEKALPLSSQQEKEQKNDDDPKDSKQESPTVLPNTKLYVKSLPFSSDKAEITEMFKKCGTVVSAELIKDKESGRSKGFAFITMRTVEEASRAIREFNGYELGERVISVSFAKIKSSRLFPDRRSSDRTRYHYVDSPHRIYVGDLAWTVNSQSLRNFFKSCGNVIGAKVIYEPQTGKSHGYGFASFASKDDAKAAMALLNGKDLEGRPVQLRIVRKTLATKESRKS